MATVTAVATAILTATTTTRVPVTHTVEVGKADYTFVPDVVLAEVGDYIEYEFYPRNHSVVRADYDYPCIPYGLVNTSPGFYTGFFPVDAILDEPPTYIVRVNDTEPIFVYCSGPVACNEYGMVAVVNPNANTSLDAHREAAKQAQFVLQPGDKWPTEAGDAPEDNNGEEYGTTTGSATIPATVTVTSTPAATSSAVSAPASTQGHSGLAPGAIAGITIGAAAIALIAAIALWICGRRSRGQRSTEDSTGTWSLGFGGNKKDPYQAQSGAATPAAMPPAYNPHGMPTMTHTNKAYLGPGVNTSIVEHYGASASSPPPQMSPNYMQQNYPPHLVDPSAFQHNPYVAALPLSQNPPFQQQPQQQFYRPEIYSGTPAPRSPPPTQAPSSGMPPAAMSPGRNSMSTTRGTHSRGGSPDIVNEMNTVNRSPGTINQGGGTTPSTAVQEPVPQRTGIGMDIKRIDVAS